jgi:hypothetical protein
MPRASRGMEVRYMTRNPWRLGAESSKFLFSHLPSISQACEIIQYGPRSSSLTHSRRWRVHH